MSEVSFPVVNKPLSEDQWKTIAMGFGQGIIDRGGWPYLLTDRNNVTNEITIGLDQGTGRNEAILGGFVHRIDHAKVLPVPPVATTTTYEVGLVYDPLNHGTEAGPIKLDVWTAPGDYTQGKLRMVLYQITRTPSQTLTQATVQEMRQRISPQISVSWVADLPKAETVVVDTIALIRGTNQWYRSHKDVNTGVVSWTAVGSDIQNREIGPVASTIPLRDGSGRMRAAAPSHIDDVAPRGWLEDNYWRKTEAASGTVGAGDKLVLRGSDANFLVPTTPTHSQHPASKSYVDSRTTNIDGTRLDKNGGDVWWEIISGSTDAYATGQTGTVYTVSVNSSGRFMRFTSRRDHKDQIQPLDVDAALRLLNVEIVKFKRREEPNGKVPQDARWEYGVIVDDELERKNGVPELVLCETEEDGTIRPEGWDEHSHEALLTLLAQHQAREQARLDHNQRVIATKLGLSYDESGYLMGE